MGMNVSRWAAQRFGPAAAGLARAVPAALAQAQADAVAAQGVGGSTKRDTYGHTLKNRQHECLVAAAGGLPGVDVFHPPGASFELLGFPATGVVLYPWRYASSTGQRARARMRSSGLRRDLLGGQVSATRQLTFDDAGRSEAELAEVDALVARLRALARVVTVGYASNPRALLELGWGDADLADGHGTVVWRHWESLALPAGPGAVTTLRLVDGNDAFAPTPPLWPWGEALLGDDTGDLAPRNRRVGGPP